MKKTRNKAAGALPAQAQPKETNPAAAATPAPSTIMAGAVTDLLPAEHQNACQQVERLQLELQRAIGRRDTLARLLNYHTSWQAEVARLDSIIKDAEQAAEEALKRDAQP